MYENKMIFKIFVNIPKYKEPKITKTFKRFRNKFFNNQMKVVFLKMKKKY